VPAVWHHSNRDQGDCRHHKPRLHFPYMESCNPKAKPSFLHWKSYFRNLLAPKNVAIRTRRVMEKLKSNRPLTTLLAIFHSGVYIVLFIAETDTVLHSHITCVCVLCRRERACCDIVPRVCSKFREMEITCNDTGRERSLTYSTQA
jgi:hypothetical protein